MKNSNKLSLYFFSALSIFLLFRGKKLMKKCLKVDDFFFGHFNFTNSVRISISNDYIPIEAFLNKMNAIFPDFIRTFFIIRTNEYP